MNRPVSAIGWAPAPPSDWPARAEASRLCQVGVCQHGGCRLRRGDLQPGLRRAPGGAAGPAAARQGAGHQGRPGQSAAALPARRGGSRRPVGPLPARRLLSAASRPALTAAPSLRTTAPRCIGPARRGARTSPTSCWGSACLWTTRMM